MEGPRFQKIRTQERKNSGKQFFENLFFSDFNTGQVSHLNPISPGLFGGLITRGVQSTNPPLIISEILIGLS